MKYYFLDLTFLLFSGMYYAPSSERFVSGLDLLRKRAPILGGN